MIFESLVRKDFEFLAKEQSLTLFGLCPLEEDLVSYERLLDWLSKEKQAGMSYMTNHKDLRRDPRLMLEGAKSVVILGYSYFGGDKLSHLKEGGPRITQYARLKDYHKFLRIKSQKIIQKLQEKDPSLKARICVDSAPILEKALASKSFLGFIGKNSLFIHPELGSYYSLVFLILNKDLPYDQKEEVNSQKRSSLGGCGTCRRCQVYCPTGALDEAYSLFPERVSLLHN